MDLLPKLMDLPEVEGIFNFDVERLMRVEMSQSDRKDVIYQMLTVPDCVNIHDQLRRQVILTDMMIQEEESDLLLEIMDLIIKNKAFSCKVLLRSILVLNKKEERFFERTKG
jgi:hypothetical protein